MLTDRERELFEALERRFHDREPARSTPPSPRPGRRWCLELALGGCIAMIAVTGLLGSPEAVISFTGATAVLGFSHHYL